MLEARRFAVPLDAALHHARRRLHESVDGRRLFEDGGHFRAGGVAVVEPLLELLGVVLIVLQERRNIRLAVRPTQRRILEFVIEVALELVARFIDLIDQRLHVAIGQSFGWGLGKPRH